MLTAPARDPGTDFESALVFTHSPANKDLACVEKIQLTCELLGEVNKNHPRLF